MRAADYPWTADHARAPCVLRWDGGAVRVDTGTADVRGRTPVAAIGSNGSPLVLARKLAALPRGHVALQPQRLPGVRVGHSAHVSAGGYVPAAPYVGDGAADAVVAWFDAEQLALVDATEPNYHRLALPSGTQLYVSRWGVVAVGGRPLPLTDQAGLLARLRPPALADGDDLGDPAVRAAVSAWLQAEHAVDAGWPDTDLLT
jgi:hypothetical protein